MQTVKSPLIVNWFAGWKASFCTDLPGLKINPFESKYKSVKIFLDDPEVIGYNCAPLSRKMLF